MKHFTGIMFALAVALGFSGTVHAQYVMKISTPTVGDINVEWMKAFKAGFEARAGGKVKVELYPASQLGSMSQSVDGVVLGTIEVAFVSSGFLVGIEPRYQIFDAVGIFDDVTHGQQIFGDEPVKKRLASFGESKGVVPLTNFVHSPYAVVAKKPIRTLADLKGLKVRTFATPMQIEPMKKLGASPVPMTLGEVLPALQNGTIDAALSGNTILTAFKYYDTAKTAMYLPTWTIIASAIINKAWLNALPPALQTALWEEARKADAVAAAWGAADIERSRKLWEQNSGTNITLTPAEQKRFVEEVTSSILPVVNANPQMKTDYETLSAASKKYRK